MTRIVLTTYSLAFFFVNVKRAKAWGFEIRTDAIQLSGRELPAESLLFHKRVVEASSIRDGTDCLPIIRTEFSFLLYGIFIYFNYYSKLEFCDVYQSNSNHINGTEGLGHHIPKTTTKRSQSPC